jgi:adenylosuccinate synthase
LCVIAAQPVTAVVRFNGGHQAGHTVVLADGRQHTFSQFGSGTLRGVETILSKFMVVDPIGFMREGDHLLVLTRHNLPRVIVDENCLIATPWHMALNRAAELERGDLRHGTCGLGFGETVSYALAHPDRAPRVKDIGTGTMVVKLLELEMECGNRGIMVGNDVRDTAVAYRDWRDHVAVWDSDRIFAHINAGHCVFEGAQGVLLDQDFGFHPHTTWSTTTFDNISELVEDPDEVDRMGVLRTYTTRHGAGPLPTESDVLTEFLREQHNADDGWQGHFRAGDFDAVLHRYAIEACGRVDRVAVTHMDTAGWMNLRLCTGYEVVGTSWTPKVSLAKDLAYQEDLTEMLRVAAPQTEPFGPTAGWLIEHIENSLGVPVTVTSWGPTAEDKRVETTVSV